VSDPLAGLRAIAENAMFPVDGEISLGGLREPMERVAALERPMSQLAELGSIFDRPLLLAGIAAFGLLAWGVVTFVAVRLAMVSAARAGLVSPRAAG